MSSAVRFAPSPTPPAAGAPLGGARAALVPVAAPPRRRLRGHGPGELALTATLFSLYVGFRGSALLLAAVEGMAQR
ncbi:MAG TPA: hypothetical protein VKA57_06705 [Solirubrobacteraceae bacterium]|nr:hypothetical protein [Solirubrobacteraceae bacterium]